jgi:hypothetical protein
MGKGIKAGRRANRITKSMWREAYRYCENLYSTDDSNKLVRLREGELKPYAFGERTRALYERMSAPIEGDSQ